MVFYINFSKNAKIKKRQKTKGKRLKFFLNEVLVMFF